MRAVVFLGIIVVTLGCQEQDPGPEPVATRTELLTQKPWTFTSIEAKLAGSDTWQSLPFKKPGGSLEIVPNPCAEDDVFTYAVDGSSLRDHGLVKCAGETGQTTSGTWEFMMNDTKVRIDYGKGATDFSINALTADVLKLEFVVSEVQIQTTYEH